MKERYFDTNGNNRKIDETVTLTLRRQRSKVRILSGPPASPQIGKARQRAVARRGSGHRSAHERGGRELSASGNVPFRSTYPPLKGSRSCRTVCPKPR